MLIVVDGVLGAAEVADLRRRLEAAQWRDGRATAGSQAARMKSNEQLDDRTPLARELGELVLARLHQSPLFTSAALPRRIYPPKFNRYHDGGHYGVHVDNAVMTHPGDGTLMRTDLSATLFLSEPADYDGGALVIEGEYGAQEVRLGAGDLVLYPSTSLHQVTAVTRGVRLAAFFWITSLVRETERRALLFDLDQSIQALSRQADGAVASEVARLTAVYHNLVRQWSEV
ncbi:MAG: Fe2+-dependent dioxygenase [Gammaproteobacteria bacterium]